MFRNIVIVTSGRAAAVTLTFQAVVNPKGVIQKTTPGIKIYLFVLQVDVIHFHHTRKNAVIPFAFQLVYYQLKHTERPPDRDFVEFGIRFLFLCPGDVHHFPDQDSPALPIQEPGKKVRRIHAVMEHAGAFHVDAIQEVDQFPGCVFYVFS